ncbi:MAG: head GIN domain-containing protein [Bacteroidota bacterium]
MKKSNILIVSALSLILLFMIISGLLFRNKVFLPATEGNGILVKKEISAQDFTEIEINGKFNVNYVQGSMQHLELTADENLHDIIRIEVSEGKLVIEAKEPFKSDDDIIINVSNPTLRSISASSSADFVSQGEIFENDLKLIANAGSLIDISGKFDNITINQNAGSKVLIEGTTHFLDITSNASGLVDASGLKAQITRVEANAGTLVQVNTTELSVNASAGSTVNYKGSPVMNSIDINSGSNLTKK